MYYNPTEKCQQFSVLLYSKTGFILISQGKNQRFKAKKCSALPFYIYILVSPSSHASILSNHRNPLPPLECPPYHRVQSGYLISAITFPPLFLMLTIEDKNLFGGRMRTVYRNEHFVTRDDLIIKSKLEILFMALFNEIYIYIYI